MEPRLRSGSGAKPTEMEREEVEIQPTSVTPAGAFVEALPTQTTLPDMPLRPAPGAPADVSQLTTTRDLVAGIDARSATDASPAAGSTAAGEISRWLAATDLSPAVDISYLPPTRNPGVPPTRNLGVVADISQLPTAKDLGAASIAESAVAPLSTAVPQPTAVATEEAAKAEAQAATMDAAAPAPAAAPIPPDTKEKLLYLRRHQGLLLATSTVALVAAFWSGFRVLSLNPGLFWLFPYLSLIVLYYAVALIVNIHRNPFHLARHRELVHKWANAAAHAGIDILLPTAGEDLAVLANTWNGVRALCAAHQGSITVWVLDDAARPEVRALAGRYGFRYSVRDNRGWYKKAGNLRHGYGLSRPLGHQFVVIFDADFRPRADFLQELLPYFFEEPRLGLVQSPQYFDVRPEQTWLQRGAGAVQEFFYRFSQVARESHGAAICVGTNAIYRRAALDEIGGTALIEHSEDVHTGFNMRLAGWNLRYVPLILAKGVCPDSMEAFFKQQYRWCMGSMSLLGARKFWRAPLRFRARLCYWTGFLYYISTAMTVLFAPIIPLLLLTMLPQEVTVWSYWLFLPAAICSFILFPLWHRADYGSEAWAVRNVYSWAHLFAVVDALRGRPMGWSPTGTRAGGSGGRYRVFRRAQIVFGFLPSLAWTALAGVRVLVSHQLVFFPLLVLGAFLAYTTGRVACYRERLAATGRYHIATGSPTGLLQSDFTTIR